jgi:hypothetical protein
MLPCYEGSVWLILGMPCPLGTDTLSLAKSLADFRQSQAIIKVPAAGTLIKPLLDPFIHIHMGPMSDVTML